ncbi:hypothetical protein CBL_07279 [Carabus blaptoides fortunei]
MQQTLLSRSSEKHRQSSPRCRNQRWSDYSTRSKWCECTAGCLNFNLDLALPPTLLPETPASFHQLSIAPVSCQSTTSGDRDRQVAPQSSLSRQTETSQIVQLYIPRAVNVCTSSVRYLVWRMRSGGDGAGHDGIATRAGHGD